MHGRTDLGDGTPRINHKRLSTHILNASGTFKTISIPLMRLVGHKSALFIGHVVYRGERFQDSEGWIAISRADVERDTTLKKDDQWRAITKLESLGLIKTRIDKRDGNKRYIWVDHSRILIALSDDDSLDGGSSQTATRVVANCDVSIEGPSEVVRLLCKRKDALQRPPKSPDAFSRLAEHTIANGTKPKRLEPITRIPKRLEPIVSIDAAPTPYKQYILDNGTEYPNLTMYKRRKPQVYNTDVPAADQPLLDFWCGNIVRHEPGTKTYAEAILALRRIRKGDFFIGKPGFEDHVRPYTQRHVIDAMTKLKAMLTDPTYYPEDKQKFRQGLRLPTFFYNKFIPAGSNGNGNGHGGIKAPKQSMFLRCMIEGLRLIADQNPDITNLVGHHWHRELGTKISKADAVQVAARIVRFVKENQDWCSRHGIDAPKQAVKPWFRSAINNSGSKLRVHDLVAGYAVRNFKTYGKESL